MNVYTPSKYMAINPIVEATQFQGDPVYGVCFQQCPYPTLNGMLASFEEGEAHIHGQFGPMDVVPGDWIVIHAGGGVECYPDPVFHQTFKPV